MYENKYCRRVVFPKIHSHTRCIAERLPFDVDRLLGQTEILSRENDFVTNAAPSGHALINSPSGQES